MYDLLIVGAGPAGLTAAIYAQRAGKQTLVLDQKGFGGQILNTPAVENYPGILRISGFQFASTLYEQATSLGAEVVYAQALALEDAGRVKRIKTPDQTYEGFAVLLATGAKNRPLGLPGEETLTGAGLSYCATCDGAFFRGKDVAVIGGGNTALEDAETLSGLAQTVSLIHRRDTFRGDQAGVRRLLEKENVTFLLDTIPVALLGETQLTGLRLRNVKTGREQELAVHGVFVAIGQIPDNQAFADCVALDEAGYIRADSDCRTSCPGVFAAGDCRTKTIRQLTTATADGAVAALAAVSYITQL